MHFLWYRKRSHPASRRVRPRLEPLEGRVTPTVITVNTIQDTVAADGRVSLREAVEAANSNLGVNEAPPGQSNVADVIRFAPALAGKTITLHLGHLDISESVTVQGPGAGKLAISGNGSSGIFVIGNEGESGLRVAITGLTLKNGTGDGWAGGAIQAFLCDCDSLLIRGCAFLRNTVQNPEGGIGGAVACFGGSLTVQRSVFRFNSASGEGGALFAFDTRGSIQDSTFASNSAKDAGGGVWVAGGGTFLISRSTFSANRAESGGGLSAGEDDCYCPAEKREGLAVTVQNSTFSGNTACFGGAGIQVTSGDMILRNTTVTRNRAVEGAGGGVAMLSSGTLNVLNTIVEGNFDEGGRRDLLRLDGRVNVRFSLIQRPAGAINGANVRNVFNVSARLGPLKYNGGPTMTHALLRGSRAADGGSNTLAAGLRTDQRGRRRIAGRRVDIGAFEVQPAVRKAVPHRYAL